MENHLIIIDHYVIIRLMIFNHKVAHKLSDNGLPLAEVADFVNENFLIKQNVNARTEYEC